MIRHVAAAMALRIAAAGMLVVLLGSSGCSRLETAYGRSVGTEGERSLNGFGVFRDVFQRQGWEDRTVARLSERQNNVEAIVWTPTIEMAPSQEVIEWFEEWLERGDKTLIYVLRDHSTEVAYWRQAARLAEPEQRMEYRRRVARAELEYQRQLLARPTMISVGWFTAVPLDPPGLLRGTDGAWAAEVGGFEPPARVEYQVRANQESDQSSAGTTTTTTTTLPFNAFWEPGKSELEVDLETVLATQGAVPVVSRVSDESWNGSQILVISGGSLLNNFGLVQPASQQLALRLIEASEVAGETGTVGFLYSDEMGVTVSSLDPSERGPSGLEMLTAWPLNLVTIHAAVLGLVVCLMLLPIFGRPRRIAPRSSTDFADHIDAVAALMARTSEEQYARAKISEYMLRVRGEVDGPWVLPEPQQAVSAVDAGSPRAENPTEPPTRPLPSERPNVDANDDQ